MANIHVYLYGEDLNLTGPQRATLWGLIKDLGANNNSPHPQFRNHKRLSLDGSKGIWEALFDDTELSIAAFKDRLGSTFGVDPSTIDHSFADSVFDTRTTRIYTFSRSGTDYFKMGIFGGAGATWAQSRAEAVAYLAANAGEWGGG